MNLCYNCGGELDTGFRCVKCGFFCMPQTGGTQLTDTQQRHAARAKATFPDCYAECELVKMLGVDECESACPEKFRETSA